MASLLVPPPPSPTSRWPGLLLSVGGESAVRAATDGTRWEGGYRFQPEWCDLNSEAPLSAAACDFGAFTPDASNPGVADLATESPFVYWETARCSTFGSTRDELTDRAQRRLNTTISHKLEKELWTGAAHIAQGVDGQYLTDGTATEVNAGGVLPLVYALAQLQEDWGVCAQGNRAMIHCTPRTATLWLSAGVVRRDAGLLLDVFDNIVVAGSGYNGSSPDHEVDSTGDTAWAYATPMMVVRLSSTEVVDATDRRVDRTNNVDTAVAFRAGAVSWDPCCVQAVNVDLCSPCCSPGGG